MYSIVPYITVDGVPTFKDSELLSLYNQMVLDGFVNLMFITEPHMNAGRFLQIAKSSDVLFHVCMNEDTPVSVLWLNRFEGRSARMHFCIFKKWRHDADLIMQTYIQNIASIKDENGVPVFNRYVGYIPSINKPEIDCALRNGCRMCGEIPDYFWDYKKGKPLDATVVYF